MSQTVYLNDREAELAITALRNQMMFAYDDGDIEKGDEYQALVDKIHRNL